METVSAWATSFVAADGLQVAEEVEGELTIHLERVVLAQRQRLGVEPELQLGGRATEPQVQGAQGGGKLLQTIGGAPVAQIDVVGDARAAHERLRLAPHDDELHAVVGQEGAEPLKRALLVRLGQSPAPGARRAGLARPAARVRWA